MQTEPISRENLSRYLQLLTNDEIFDMDTGRISCFGVYDEESDAAMGLIAAQILPRHIVIERIYTVPEYRNKGVATALLELITDVPENMRMTFYLFTAEEDADTEFLKNRGFVSANSKYSYVCGNLGDMVDLKVPDSLRKDCEVNTLDLVSDKQIREFVFEGAYDTFLQFPEMELDRNRYSEGSLVCLRDGRVEGLMTLEELDAFIRIGYFNCKDARTAYLLFSEMKDLLLEEYGAQAKVRFLAIEGEENKIGNYFSKSEERPIRVYKKKMRG